MKSIFILAPVLLVAAQISAAPIKVNREPKVPLARPETEHQPRSLCTRTRLVNLYRMTNAVEHFYTTNVWERQWLAAWTGYAADRNTARALVFKTQQPHTRALHRLYDGADHFYTADDAEKDEALEDGGFAYEGVAGFIYETPECGSVPLYRLYNGQDHFYTADEDESRDAQENRGYGAQGIAGYVLDT
ncbi:hypothetical protein B0H10DRAFT_2206986 [Mycena sp. CBHHK59/15]|nr:hypothetical protein B0H10DRAFT_2206986 [Mycena sp. CBHHK59/15]